MPSQVSNLMIVHPTRIIIWIQGIACAGGRLVHLDRHKYLACGPVDGYEQIAFEDFIGHPLQIFGIHARKVWNVALERLEICFWVAGLSALRLPPPQHRKQRSRPEFEPASPRNTHVTARESSNRNCMVRRKCTMAAFGAGVSVACD